MVSTLDFESNNPSSILGMSFLLLYKYCKKEDTE